jgi:DNA-binding Xre family transcriptional regulator
VSTKIGYRWHLRRLMAERDMFATTDLVPLLAARGVRLSREQVYRMVTGTPQRLSLDILAALCDILTCQPSDLIEPVAAGPARSDAAAGVRTADRAGDRGNQSGASALPRPLRARVAPAGSRP